MTELKEIHIGDNQIGLKDNLVKTSILPKSSKELDRTLVIQGNVVVEGAVYANTIEIDNGPDEFKCAVFTSNELHVKNDADGIIKFDQAVASANSVAALVAKGHVLFGADINAVSIKLKNCFVAGSVFGTEVQMENCVVLGGVFASKKLTMQNVCTGTFHAPEVDIGGTNYLLYPTAFSVEPLSALPGTEIYDLALADLGSLFKGDTEKANTGKIKMDITNDAQRTVLVDDDGSNILVNSYSVASRVLVSDMIDFDKMENHFLIGAASLGTQVLKTYTLQKANGEKSEELTVENISDFFFKVLNGSVQMQDLNGSITFDELKKNFE